MIFLGTIAEVVDHGDDGMQSDMMTAKDHDEIGEVAYLAPYAL